jgi:hypothetical protein
MVAAFALKPHDRRAAVDRFIASFKFKAAAPATSKPPGKLPPKPEDAGLSPRGQEQQ